MKWVKVTRADPLANAVAKRHYTCQSPDSGQYVPPGKCLCLYSHRRGRALWVTSWPKAEYVKHAWPGAWMCSIFRNESHVLASVLIRQAVAATRWHYGTPPEFGMVTFVDERRVAAKERPGQCFLDAGFRQLDVRTRMEDLLVFQMLLEDMPAPEAPRVAARAQLSLDFA